MTPCDNTNYGTTNLSMLTVIQKQITMAEEAGEGPSGHIKQELRPLHDIAEIFADLTKRGLATGLSGVVQRLASRELKVATMCSGTESPILALQMVRESE